MGKYKLAPILRVGKRGLGAGGWGSVISQGLTPPYAKSRTSNPSWAWWPPACLVSQQEAGATCAEMPRDGERAGCGTHRAQAEGGGIAGVHGPPREGQARRTPRLRGGGFQGTQAAHLCSSTGSPCPCPPRSARTLVPDPRPLPSREQDTFLSAHPCRLLGQNKPATAGEAGQGEPPAPPRGPSLKPRGAHGENTSVAPSATPTRISCP